MSDRPDILPGPQSETLQEQYQSFVDAVRSAQRVKVETPNALGEMDVHIFPASALSAALEAKPRVKVKPLVWDDFEGRGAKAQAWLKANYLITKWSTGKFELCESYPGYQGARIGSGFFDTLEAAKAAAQAHHEAAVRAMIEGVE